MGPIFETLSAFFQEDNWHAQAIEEQPILRMGFQGKNGQLTCFARAREAEQQFVFYSLCPVNTPEERRSAMAEFLSRANFGLVIGNFELDFEDGQIRYKTSIDVEGSQLNFALVKQMVYANVLTIDQYLPGILAVIYSHASPLEAVQTIEKAENSHLN